MKNITIKVTEEAYRNARIYAAEHGTSVSALVREHLENISKNRVKTEAERANRAKALQKLWDLADQNSKGKQGSVGPINRDEIYDRGLH